MNNPLAVLFNLRHGGQVAVVLDEREAKGYLQAWLAGSLPPRFGQPDAEGPWAVRLEDVCSVQILPVERVVQPGGGLPPSNVGLQTEPRRLPPAGPPRLPPGTSGLPH